MRKRLVLLACLLSLSAGHAQTKQALTLAADITRLKPARYLNMQDASSSLHDYAANVNYAVGGTGTVLYRQPGYDADNKSVYSISLPHDSFARAPNDALCDLDWNTTWTIVIQLCTGW